VAEMNEADTASETQQAMTTEHFVLQAARSATIQEANQRATLFLTSVSCATIALAFVAQVTQMSRPFVLFSLILLPCHYFIFYGPSHFRAHHAGRYRGYGRAWHGVNTPLLRRSSARHATLSDPFHSRRSLGSACGQRFHQIVCVAVLRADGGHGEHDQWRHCRCFRGRSRDVVGRLGNHAKRQAASGAGRVSASHKLETLSSIVKDFTQA